MADLVLGDDHVIFVDALTTVLTQRGFTVSAVSNSAAGISEIIRKRQPDVCLLDRHFADGDGIDVIDEVVTAGVRTKVVMLTADRDAESVRRALELGAAGYVHKARGLANLTAAIRRIMDGEVVVDVSSRRDVRRSTETAEAHRLAAHLTARERQCLGLLADGLSTSAMVTRLGVSATTVRTHVQMLLTKLGAHSRLEAVSFAARHYLLDERSRTPV